MIGYIRMNAPCPSWGRSRQGGGEASKLEPSTILSVEAEGSGSRITRRIEMEKAPGLMRLMAPFMGGMMRKRNAAFLANHLKHVLEPEAD